jgi:hypothetical protein
MVREILEDKRDIKDQLGSLPENDIIGMWNYNETLELEEGASICKTQNIAGDSLIWNSDLYGIWGTSKWGSTIQTSFVLGNAGAAILGTSKLGSRSSSSSIVRVVNPHDTFNEHFRDNAFEDTDYTDADWDTTNFYIDFTANQIAQTSEIFLNSQNLISAKPKLTIDSGSVDIFMTPNGGATTPLWYEFTNNTEGTFSTLTPAPEQISIASAEDVWYKMDEITGTDVTDDGLIGNDATSINNITTMTATGKFGKALNFNGMASPDGIQTSLRHYPLNDNLASTVVDETSYNDDDAVCGRNTSLMSEAGHIDTCLHFNGTDDVIALGDISTPTNYFSCAAWVKLDAVGTYMNIAIKGTADGANTVDAAFQIDTSGHLIFDFNDAGWNTKTSTGTIAVDTWTHVAVTKDSSTSGPKKVRFYINGSLDSEFAQTASMPNNTSTWYIGDLADNSGPFDGCMEDVRINNYPIGPNEIKNIYNGGAGSYATQDYLKLDSVVTMDLETGASIAFWMKTTNDYYTSLFARTVGHSSAFLSFNSTSNTFNYETNTNNFGGSSSALNTTINDGTWHHYVHTFVEDGANTRWRIYVDGVLDSNDTHTKSTNQQLGIQYIGLQGSQAQYIYGEGFKGTLDDVRLYNDKILSTTEISILANNGAYVAGNDLRLKLVEDSASTARVSEIKVEYTSE